MVKQKGELNEQQIENIRSNSSFRLRSGHHSASHRNCFHPVANPGFAIIGWRVNLFNLRLCRRMPNSGTGRRMGIHDWKERTLLKEFNPFSLSFFFDQDCQREFFRSFCY
jgi:hypothetical protein